MQWSEFQIKYCLGEDELSDMHRRLERPLVFRYKEIEAFPPTLNNSQMINFMTRMFIGEGATKHNRRRGSGRPLKMDD